MSRKQEITPSSEATPALIPPVNTQLFEAIMEKVRNFDTVNVIEVPGVGDNTVFCNVVKAVVDRHTGDITDVFDDGKEIDEDSVILNLNVSRTLNIPSFEIPENKDISVEAIRNLHQHLGILGIQLEQ